MSAEHAGKEQQVSLVEDHEQQAIESAVLADADLAGNQGTDTAVDGRNIPARGIIWTPRFMVFFWLILILGLSLESVLTQGWLNKYYLGQWVFQGHVIVDALAWIVLLVVAKGRWMRIGALFGLTWAAFMTVNLSVQVIFPTLPLATLAHINVLTCLALLGCYVCLSIDRFPMHPWDAWVFGLLPLAGLVITALLYLTGAERSLTILEDDISTAALILSALVWLARPTCWKNAPAPTVLFSCVPLLLLILSGANAGYNAANYFLTRVVLSPNYNATTTEPNFFFSQVALLCLLLGTIRLIKCELAN